MAHSASSLRARASCSHCLHARQSLPVQPVRRLRFSLRLVRSALSLPTVRLEHLRAAARDDVQPVPDLMITSTNLECDRKWIAGMIALWLNEEWTPLEVHQQLGKAAGNAYVKCRQQGDDDMSSLVLGLSNELLAFNYRDTFTSAFEVANKVVEMLMMRSGVDVCCTSDDDLARIERYNSQQEATEQQ
eukprot:GHUV01007692.1.p1 GENE.GHUV01007692.1~~GHUV01007692.1.p1  ORF type:complete len:188 (+),score=26.95 GHUV01007692.1:216-779(+)